MRQRLASIALTLSLYAVAGGLPAEIVKTARPDCSRNAICLYWWPRLPKVPGWREDTDASYRYGGNGVNALAPDGFTFESADAVIYGAATYKAQYASDNPRSTNLAAFIDDDTGVFRAEGAQIQEAETLVTADGQRLRSFHFIAAGAKNYERVAYGEEGEYYLVFTISAHTEAGYQKALPVFEDMVRRYRR
jgi:hypothetical protein